MSQLQDEQERRAKAAAAENAAFSAEFLGAARRVFAMIDVDNSGTLTKEEIKKSVKSDKEVIDFLKDCGEENLQFLLEPKRLDRALNALDTSQDGEVDVDEWCVVRVRKTTAWSWCRSHPGAIAATNALTGRLITQGGGDPARLESKISAARRR